MGWAGSELVAPVAAWQWPAGQGSITHPLRPAHLCLLFLSFSGSGDNPHGVLDSLPPPQICFHLLRFSALNYVVLGCQGTSIITRFNCLTKVWYFSRNSGLVRPSAAISLPATYSILNWPRLTYSITYLYLMSI